MESWEKELKMLEKGDVVRKKYKNYFTDSPNKSSKTPIIICLAALSVLLITLILTLVVNVEMTPRRFSRNDISMFIPPQEPVVNVYPKVEVPTPVINVKMGSGEEFIKIESDDKIQYVREK